MPEASEMRTAVLVVDDDKSIREVCREILEKASYDVELAASGQTAMAVLEAGQTDIVLTDMVMPDMSGMELLRAIQPGQSGIDVVLMTGHASVATAVEAMKLGAYDYLTKPFGDSELLSLLERLAERRSLRTENRLLREQLKGGQKFGGIVGASARMQDIYRSILRVAPKRFPVLIVGESGTGKELVARAIHEQGPWAAEPFVAVDCGTLTRDLMESELFGHVRGAFTGAMAKRPGLFSTAAKGTLFLDEIGELPPDLQVKLLRAIQEREFRPVGADRPLPIEARIVAATNADLEAAIKEGRFRNDLYFRLNVHQIALPPLRQRRSDIPALVQYLLRRHAEPGEREYEIAGEAMTCLMAYDWPGNVRELENCIQRALAVVTGTRIECQDLPPELVRPCPSAGESRPQSRLQEVERRAIVEALEQTANNRAEAARLLGIAKTTLYRKLREYGLESGEE